MIAPSSLQILEFDKVIERISLLAITPQGKALLLERKPLFDPTVILNLQTQVTEAKNLLEANVNPPFEIIQDISTSVIRAEKGSILSPEALWHTGIFLKVTRLVKEFLKQNSKKTPSFKILQEQLFPLTTLENKIFQSLNTSFEILDTASPKLKETRKRIQTLHAQLLQKLQSFIQSPATSVLLQEPLIMERAGRYVVPVKETHRKQFKGILHDRSASGATLFMEPQVTIEENNRLIELKLEERHEEEAILRNLSMGLGKERESLFASSVALGEIDGAFAAAHWSIKVSGVPPKLLNSLQLEVKRARHPLLGEKAIPIDVEVGQAFRTLVITGPNTGGKTVSLKTAGLFWALAQSGFHLPAEKAQFGIAENIFADIGDEQSIEQNLSTFSSHLSRIISFVPHINKKTVILLDELGAGTDPREGAALAMSLLQYFHQRHAVTIATTHYPELKIFAEQSEGTANASMTFNDETLEPTYRLALGKPGRSLALTIAARLGLPESIVNQAKSHLDKETLRVEDLLVMLEKREILLAEAEKSFSNEQSQFHAESLEKREKLAAQSQRVKELIDDLKVWMDSKKIELQEMTREKFQSSQIELSEKIVQAETEIESFGVETLPDREVPTFEPGDIVWIQSLELTGEILAINDDGASLQVGSLRMQHPLSDLRRQNGIQDSPELRKVSKIQDNSEFRTVLNFSAEIDLRGMRAEEAIDKTEKYLDQVILSSLSQVRIIHGKGGGILRKTIHEYLKTNRMVKAFSLAPQAQGGDGVTLVDLH